MSNTTNQPKPTRTIELKKIRGFYYVMTGNVKLLYTGKKTEAEAQEVFDKHRATLSYYAGSALVSVASDVASGNVKVIEA